MNNRRSFIKKAGSLAGALSVTPILNALAIPHIQEAEKIIQDLTPAEAARNEEYWHTIQQAYTVSPNIINLNNGGVSPQPSVVQDAVERYNRLSNEGPSYFMWRILDAGRESLRMKLADLAGCSLEEIAINRNATEALGTVILGLNLKKGDEVVLTKQDYPNMLQAWKQREMREGIKLNFINLELPIENEETIVQQFTQAFTPRTKVVMITHMINWTGQILPVKKIATAAKAKGIEVLVDGAHTFAHLDYKIPDLDCDYYGTSLHKWLSAPIGSGMLYVKKDKIKSLWPLFPNNNPQADDIRKFEVLGTRSFPIEQAIGQAVNFQHAIGNKRKEERLRYLKNYWAEKVESMPRVKLNTSLKPAYSCALANFSIEGMEPGEIESTLFSKYKIHTSPIVWENIKGVRVAPHVYTPLKDLDRLVDAITYLAKK
ncbi:aminotransferase class V-fold PLP-dependent enzyme [Rhodocytophaga aerolata]|uniref:Aminotransferase class V-fold PLP-dependent enzyme n=1 Tax=Rhodocytophaga aerolata TaxID=455078 RepID=A0ABT8RGI7_9BACT|nr:aminotransferase class V-fold PLP-dependent enzyme [Rhodocytophaga aerolata]MDO1451221.1 aminotransferase class V-fold PLP-dependent enzyme [Rhodocytophaga aerolata]